MPTLADITKKRNAAGTLSGQSKKKIIDLTKKNIASAGGDRQAGLLATKKALQGTSVPDKTSGIKDVGIKNTAKVGSGTRASDLIGAKGYKKDQVGMLGINLTKPLSTTNKALGGEEKDTSFRGDPKFGGGEIISGDLSGNKTRSDEDIDDLKNKGYTVDELGNVTGTPEGGVSEKDVLEGKLTDVEFNKYKAEQDKLKADEEAKAKKIGFSELDYKKDKDWLQVLKERGEADLKDSFDDAIIKAEIDNKNLNKNVNMARSGLGMPESKSETEGFNTVVSESKRGLNRLKSLASTRAARLQEDFAKQFDTLNTNRKKAFDENMRKLLDEMSISDLEGTLDTKTGLSELRTKLQDVLYSDEEMAMANIQRYKFGIDQLNGQIDDIEEFESNAKTINESTSKMNGYYTNMNGDPFLDDAGNFMSLPEDSKVVYTSEPNSEGKVTMFSRSSDGTIKMDTLNTGLTSASETPKIQKIGQDTFGNDIYGTYNKDTQQFEPVKIGGMGTPQAPQTTPTTTKTTFTPSQEGARTNRHNNPTAFTTQVAKQSGLVEGVDYVKGDPFPGNPNMFTAKLIGDGVETTKKVIDNIGFYTQAGQPRWTYLSKIFEGSDANQVWGVLNESEKSEIIKEMYGYETDNKYENFGGFALGETTEEKTEYTSVQKSVMDKYLDDPAAKDNRMALQRAGLTDNDVNKYNEKGGDDFENIAFDITSVLPRDLYKTDADFERVVGRVEKAVKELKDKGKEATSQNVANIVRGYSIKPEANQEVADELEQVLSKNAADTDRVDWATVAKFINNGDDKSADKYVRNLIEKKAKEWYGNDFVSTVSINQKMRDTKKLEELIKKNPDKIGAFDGNVTQFMKKFQDEPEIQELQTLLTMNQADIRKKFAGSAVTPTELKALEDYIGGTIKMQPNNLLTMLKTIAGRTDEIYNNQRKFFGYTPKNILKTGSNNNLDEIDNGFFKPETGSLDKIDEDFFNNL